MRNVYSMCVFLFLLNVAFLAQSTWRVSFNFGDTSLFDNTTEPASIQFISRTNQSQSYENFVARRNTTLQSRPPLYDIRRLNQSSDEGHLVGLSSHYS